MYIFFISFLKNYTHTMFRFLQRLHIIYNLQTQFVVLIAICLFAYSSSSKVIFNFEYPILFFNFEYLQFFIFVFSDRVRGSRSEKLAGRKTNASLVSHVKHVLRMGIHDPDVAGYKFQTPFQKLVFNFPKF